MAKQSGMGDKFLVEGNDMSGDISALSRIETSVALLDTTSIEESSVTRIQGLGDGGIDFNAFFNDDAAANRAGATGSTFLDLSAQPTTAIRLLYLRGTTLGNPCAALTAIQATHAENRGADGSLTFTVNAQGSNGVELEWGTQITAGLITHASATSSTGEVTAQTTAGGVGFLQGVEADSGDATVVIEDSSDTTDGTDGTWGTLLTFATTSASWPAGERLTVTGTVEKGLRATTTGTFTNADFAVGFRRGASGDRLDLS